MVVVVVVEFLLSSSPIIVIIIALCRAKTARDLLGEDMAEQGSKGSGGARRRCAGAAVLAVVEFKRLDEPG